MRRLLLMLVAVPAAATAQARPDAAQPNARPIALAEAVRLAQRNAPATVQARGQVASGTAALRSAYGAFLPNVSLSANGTRQGGDRFDPQGQLVPFTGEPWQYGTGISANMELFSGLRRFNNLRTARADIASAEANETLQ
ncbi:MAG: TolC family protein, partial [Gemmatimonadaceae bacterium]